MFKILGFKNPNFKFSAKRNVLRIFNVSTVTYHRRLSETTNFSAQSRLVEFLKSSESVVKKKKPKNHLSVDTRKNH